MNIHHHAVLTPLGREQMIRFVLEEHHTLKAAAAAFRVSSRTVSKWLVRHRSGAGLGDRSSRPRRLRQPTALLRQEEVIALRRQKLTGFHISQRTGLSVRSREPSPFWDRLWRFCSFPTSKIRQAQDDIFYKGRFRDCSCVLRGHRLTAAATSFYGINSTQLYPQQKHCL